MHIEMYTVPPIPPRIPIRRSISVGQNVRVLEVMGDLIILEAEDMTTGWFGTRQDETGAGSLPRKLLWNFFWVGG